MGRFPSLKGRVDLGIFIFITLLILLPSKASSNQNELIIGFPPYLSRIETFRRFQPILEQLESKVQKTIRPVFYRYTEDLLNDLESGKIEMAYLDSITYAKTPSLRLVALFVYKDGERIILITRKDSGIIGVDDLKNRILATIGNDRDGLWLRILIGHKPDIPVKEIRIYNGFDSVVFGVLLRDVDAGVTTERTFEDLKRSYPTVRKDIRIIAISPPHPGYVIVANKKICEDMVKSLRDALFGLRETIDGNLILSSLGIEGFSSSIHPMKDWRDLLRGR